MSNSNTNTNINNSEDLENNNNNNSNGSNKQSLYFDEIKIIIPKCLCFKTILMVGWKIFS